MLVRGDKLSLAQRHDVLGAFVYRWTIDNDNRGRAYGICPICQTAGGRPDDPEHGYTAPVECRQHHPTLPLETDAAWIAGHAFYITKEGKLDKRRRHCEMASLAD